MILSNIQARDHIIYIKKYIEEIYNVNVSLEDNWPSSDARYIPEKDLIEVSTHLLFNRANQDLKDKIDRICDKSFLYGIDTSIGHELSHRIDINNKEKLTNDEKLFDFIDNNLLDYYDWHKKKPDGYYRFDLCEIKAERFGIRFAYEVFRESFGKELADGVALDYINEQAATGIYFLPKKQFLEYEEIDFEFEKQINRLDNHLYPKPNMEPCCAQILERFESVSRGLSELKLIVACTYKVRNYQRMKFVNEYGLSFWKNIASEYPDLVDLSIQDKINTVMTRHDVTKPSINNFKGIQF